MPRKGTCETCGRRRTVYLCDEFYYRCSECARLTPEERREKSKERQERTRERTRRSKLAYPCIGGPLDGQYALTEDFYASSSFSAREEGIFHHLEGEYIEYNGTGRGSKRVGGYPPTMIFVHKSLLKPLIAGRER